MENFNNLMIITYVGIIVCPIAASTLRKTFFLLMCLTTSAKYTLALCEIIDEGDSREESYTERINCRQERRHDGWRQKLVDVCDEATRTKTIFMGPTTFHCKNSSFQEISISNKGRSTKNHFYVTDSSFGSLIVDGKTWSKLTELTLENDNISQIVPGFFNEFPNLTLLSIPHNNITDIIDGVFSSLTNLVHLNLSFNIISNMGSLCFIGLHQLNILDLRHNKIKIIPPKQFLVLSKLSYLDLSENNIAVFDTTGVTPLKTLLLNSNNLSEFVFLNITNNNDSVLDISHNNINIAENIDGFKSSSLNISFNNIEKWKRVSEITSFNISHNTLKFIEANFISNSVKILDLSFNLISNISIDAFTEGTKLAYLYLSNNKLKELSVASFKAQENLEYVDLSNNNILYFEFGLFNNLGNLKYLNISSNEAVVDFQSLFRVKHLETLDFEKNEPKNFDNFFFETHEKLKVIRMGYNTWNCGELTRAIHLIEKRNITVLKGSSDNSVHVHGIECNSEIFADKHSLESSTAKGDLQRNTTFSDNYSSILLYFQNINDKFLSLLNKSLENLRNYENSNKTHSFQLPPKLDNDKVTENSSIFVNVNLIISILLMLFLCGFLFSIWYISKTNSVKSKEQVELMQASCNH